MARAVLEGRLSVSRLKSRYSELRRRIGQLTEAEVDELEALIRQLRELGVLPRVEVPRRPLGDGPRGNAGPGLEVARVAGGRVLGVWRG
jgi:hypothetical protein